MANRLQDLGIEHVVVLMLENRGFDHVMGWLYDKDEADQLTVIGQDQRTFLGLSTLGDEFADLANSSPIAHAQRQTPIKGARTPRTPSFNPGEHFVHIMAQMWDRANGTEPGQVAWGDPRRRRAEIEKIGTEPPMTGYMLDFAQEIGIEAPSTPITEDVLNEIMEIYVPEQLPVLSGLARHYAVSDLWFCSVPSQTNTNRAFSTGGTARGMVTNNYYDAFPSFLTNPGVGAFSKFANGSHADALPGCTPSLFKLLTDFGVSWAVFWQQPWPPRDIALGRENQYVRTMYTNLAGKQFNANFVKFDLANPNNELFKRAREGNLPAVSWIEPAWGGGTSWDSPLRAVGNDMHPVCDTTVAEDYVDAVYNALTTLPDGRPNPAWEKTLFVVTFDENGGTYDHYPPPAATPTDLDRTPMPGDHPQMDPDTRTQFGFRFDQFGVRVPTILISPFVAKQTIFRSATDVPYDHTSLVATILDWQEVPRAQWFLGARVQAAPTFEAVLTLDKGQARQDAAYGASVGAARSPQEPLRYNEDVILEYVGTKWHNPEGARYLGPATFSKLGWAWYATMVDAKKDAARYRLCSAQRTDGPILNMADVMIQSTEGLLRRGAETIWLGAFHDSHFLYFWSLDGVVEKRGLEWQIRILSSRDAQEPVRADDELYLVSRLVPSTAQGLSSRITPDPLQRMMPSAKDPSYLTTLAGEWAIWRVLRPA
jgi:phospholipase C